MNKTDKEHDKEDIKLIITGVCSLAFAVAILIFFTDLIDGFLLAIVAFLSLIGAVSLLLGWQSYHVRRKWKAAEEEETRKQMQAQEERNQLAKSGLWEFPADEFYTVCRIQNVTRLDNEFSRQKALKIAKSVIEAYQVDVDCCGEYLKINKLEEFLRAGRLEVEKLEQEELSASKMPKDATPDTIEQVFIERANALSGQYGCEKRIKMLSSMISDYEARIRALREGEEALKQLGMIYASQQKKESDWAVIGGIANGIAGPAAGIMAASEAMANNIQIRENNAAMRKTSMEIMSGIPNMMGDRAKLNKEVQSIYYKRSDAEFKVTLPKPSSEDIQKNIKVGTATISKAASGVLHVSLPISFKHKFAVDVPDGVNTVVDGTIRGEIWFENSYVGEVIFPLPLYGIPSNMTAEVTLDGMCGRSVEYDGEYIVKIADQQNLWIMEL